MKTRLWMILFGGMVACAAAPRSDGPAAPAASAPAPEPRRAYDTARGGRLFDKWTAETKRTGAEPARMKDLFGWDLRGQKGMYGPEHMNKKNALPVDLLSWEGDVAAVAARLARGGDGVPAYAPALTPPELENVAALIVAMRDGELPRADQVLTLTSPAAKDYALATGGDAARGKALFAERCANCHGADGTKFLLDDGAYSLGSHARQKAYEDWFKILNGQPGSAMERQVKGASAAEMRKELLDLLTALCDRTAFPKGAATAADVPDADPRCGAALR
ncbi:MAG: c-type cytochrome [Labilithrix sp.]|nr:c-type cytochrome [Labilithrix sp.]MCW5818097.1 c-type cytochrome [Labilithrix sp.]